MMSNTTGKAPAGAQGSVKMTSAKRSSRASGPRAAKHGWIWTTIFAVISLIWVSPLLIVLINSFKRKAFIFKNPFSISRYSLFADGFEKWSKGIEKAFFGLQNYVNGITRTNFWSAFGCSLFITVFSVAAILLLCSMTAWFVVRVNTSYTKLFYVLCLFSMIVPFQMVMFTLSKFANLLHLGNPVGIVVVYLGFGAGLAVFMFTGFVKSISIEIEEASMIDGCTPIQTFFLVVLPIMKPTVVTVAILEAMWVWNDYLLPYLVLDINKYKTIPIAVQFLKQSHGTIDWGAMMAVLVLAIIPIVILYAFAQRYIIEGVLAGAVKG